jgi:hypothetical protein
MPFDFISAIVNLGEINVKAFLSGGIVGFPLAHCVVPCQFHRSSPEVIIMVSFGRMPLWAATLVPLISLFLACGDSPISLISGGSQQGFGSIASALEAASDGDTIVIGPGTHRETLTVTRSVAA